MSRGLSPTMFSPGVIRYRHFQPLWLSTQIENIWNRLRVNIFSSSSASPGEESRDLSSLTDSFSFHSCLGNWFWPWLGFQTRIRTHNWISPFIGLKTSCKMKVQVLWQLKRRDKFSTLVTFCHLHSFSIFQGFSLKHHRFWVLTITLIITYCRWGSTTALNWWCLWRLLHKISWNVSLGRTFFQLFHSFSGLQSQF